MQKRYIIVLIVLIGVCLLVWRLSDSYAIDGSSYEGNNIVTGNEWGVNIINVSEVNVSGKAVVTNEVRTIGTSFEFDALLYAPGDKISFDILIKNTAKLDAELYAITLLGLSQQASEVINYNIEPLDYLVVNDKEQEGSIIKNDEEHNFRVTLEYKDSISSESAKEYNLNLGSTIIYRQK